MSEAGRAQVPAIEFRELTRAFGRKSVLRGVNLVVPPGQTLTILGGSGSGKSVCLKHAIGLLRPDSGRVLVEGVDITGYTERQLIAVRKNVSMVFQGAALFDSLDVYENVAYPLREHWRASEAEIGDRVARCLAAVGLPGVERLLPAELSGGMRKRVGVARAIALEPRVILYDEPTTGLDPANQRRIGELIRDLQRRLGVTSVVVTHELELCFAVSDRVALLKDGRIAAEGSADEMRESQHPAVRAFLEGIQDAANQDDPREGVDGRFAPEG
ncbi:MAG: ABC transporter ATP-binding protein [Deltaproteobacteria bacterium]|nr:MAG: ABC transporter ATP-binding protein [Deltaproteobacteria bacterium]